MMSIHVSALSGKQLQHDQTSLHLHEQENVAGEKPLRKNPFTRQLPMGAGYCPWGWYTDRIVCNIHGDGHLASRYKAVTSVNFLPSMCGHLSCSSRWTYGHDLLRQGEPGTSQYISVSKSTPLAVTGPYGQLASTELANFVHEK